MTSLDKLAKMDGWDVGENDAEDELIGATAVAAGQQSFVETNGKLGEETHVTPTVPQSSDHSKHNQASNDNLPPPELEEGLQQKTISEPRQAGEPPIDRGDRSSNSSSNNSGNLPHEAAASLPSTRLDSPCQERVKTKNAPENGSGDGVSVFDKALNTHPASAEEKSTGAVPATASSEHVWDRSKRHPLDTLRKRGFGGDNADKVGEIFTGDVTTAAEETTNLRTSLRRVQDEVAREREGREVYEEQARVAHEALETESKRALDLENRLRVAEMRISLINNGQEESRRRGGGGGRGVSSKIDAWERRVRSLSPPGDEARAVDFAEKAEIHANMAILAEASETAREEAQSALETVEGFAALNRELVNELRTTINARNEALEDLRIERSVRRKLEEDVEKVLGSGLVAQYEQCRQELEVRCKNEQDETARVVAMHARMEEEYRLALSSSDQERAHLEETIASLESELWSERRLQPIRAREESERAAMGSEEVLSLRAGFQARTKRRGHNRNSCAGGRVNENRGRGGSGGGRESGWLSVVRTRMDAQQQAEVHPRNSLHRTTSHVGGGATKQRGARQFHRSASAVVDIVGGRPMANHAPTSRAGGSSIGVGGAGGGDRSTGQAVHMAAVESVEAFLGDFVPKVPPVTATLSAALTGKGAEEEGDGGGDAAEKKVSKWAAIGRAGKISARATAVCVEEATKAAEAAALHRLRAMTNASARVLSASWFSLLARAPGGAAARGGGHGHGHGHDGSADEHAGSVAEGAVSIDATVVPVIAVRRLIQSCGILGTTGGAPTLGYADMELQRNAVGKGGRSIGHREYFKVIFALSEYRFVGEPKDEALENLSNMLRPEQPSPGTSPRLLNRQTHVSTPAAKPAPSIETTKTTAGAEANSTPPGGVAHEGGLAGAERVLERDRRALEAIFSHYSTNSLLPFAALASFCKDFELTPGLVSREHAHNIYVQLAYPNETLLTLKLVAARERPLGPRAVALRNAKEGEGAPPAAGFGLRLEQWIAWLGLAAVGCTWFDKQRGLYDTPMKKVLGLLQWMEGSAGKKRISSTRGSAIVPAFNLLPLKATAARR